MRMSLEDASELRNEVCAGDLARNLLLRAEASAQSYGEEGEEALDNGAGGPPLSERGSDELPAGRVQRMPSRRSIELGKRERRKRRLDDADEDDLNSLDEPLEGKKKRRAGEFLSMLSVTTPLCELHGCLGAHCLDSQAGQIPAQPAPRTPCDRWRSRLSWCRAGHEALPGGPSGADMRYVKREWARYEAMLGAVSDPTSLEAAVAKRAHKRLAEIAKEVNLANSGVVELANQVCCRDLQSCHSRFIH